LPEQPSKNPSKVSAKFERSHETILRTAARLFAVNGYAETTLRDIAASAGLKAGSIYYHFASKEEILDVILDLGVREIYHGVAAAIDENSRSADHRMKIVLAIQAHLNLIFARNEFTSANMRIFNTLPADIKDRHLPLRLAYADLWDVLLNKAQLAGQLRGDIDVIHMRQFILGVLNWTVEWVDAERQSIVPIAARYGRFVMDGISNDRSGALDGQPVAPTNMLTIAKNGTGTPANKFDRTHQEILKTAALLFGEKGFAATTLRDIATAAGMKAGSLYYHFKSKEQMLDEILDRGVRQIFDGVQAQLLATKDIEDHRFRIKTAIHSHLALILAQSEITATNIRLYGQLPKTIRMRHRPLRLAYSELWDALLRDAQIADQISADVDVKQLRQYVLDALNWTVDWFDPDHHSLEIAAQRCSTLILDGVRAMPSSNIPQQEQKR
jgi:AcrR family transcriptional regulator